MAENVPGDGANNPFGNGMGGTTGTTPKGLNFVESAGGDGPRGAGINFVDPKNNPPQAKGTTGFNPDSVPKGGRILLADPGKMPMGGTGASGAGRKPYKIGQPGAGNPGGKAPAKLSGPASPESGGEAGSTPDEVGDGSATGNPY